MRQAMDVRPVAAFVPWACNLPQLNIKAYALTIVQRNLCKLPINPNRSLENGVSTISNDRH